MIHPLLAHHGSFAPLPLGRLRPVDDPRTLRLAKYLDTTDLPPIPPAFAPPVVSEWPIYGNAQLGDCTCAAAGHMIQAWTTLAGIPAAPSDEDVLRMYWLTGTPPAETGEAGSPQDDGRSELAVLNYWRHEGLGPDKITAYVAVDAGDAHLVKAAIYLFGGVYTGIALPKTAQGQAVWDVVGDGKTGDSAPDTWGGHAVPYVGYDGDGVQLVTLGAVQTATWAFHAAYTDEVYAILSEDMLKDGRSPAGLDVAALQADLAALAR